jgi:hypothetical protein
MAAGELNGTCREDARPNRAPRRALRETAVNSGPPGQRALLFAVVVVLKAAWLAVVLWLWPSPIQP